MLVRFVFLVLMLAAGPAAFVHGGENWPDFRGPHSDGHAEGAVALQWSESENVRWKTPLPGRGWSTPVIWDDQIWLTAGTEDGHKLWALCVDRESGKLVREVLVFEIDTPKSVNPLNSYASPSPVIDAEQVYVHFGTYGTAAIDRQSGQVVWRRTDLTLEHKEGPGSSPVLDGPRLILTCDGLDVQYMIALDTKTGENVWKTNRSLDLSGFDPDQRKGYSTPLVTEYQGQPLLVSTAAQAAYAYDPRDGRELWRFQYKGFSNVVRPLVFGDLVILNTGFAKANVFGVRLGGRGDITESHFVWKQTQACPNKPCPVLIDGLLYSVSDKGGVASCLDAKTGEKLWTERLGGNYSASLLYASGRIYAFDQDGKTTVFRPGQKYEQLATNQLDDGFMASPAVAGDALYLRTKTHLYRIEAGAKSAE